LIVRLAQGWPTLKCTDSLCQPHKNWQFRRIHAGGEGNKMEPLFTFIYMKAQHTHTASQRHGALCATREPRKPSSSSSSSSSHDCDMCTHVLKSFFAKPVLKRFRTRSCLFAIFENRFFVACAPTIDERLQRKTATTTPKGTFPFGFFDFLRFFFILQTARAAPTLTLESGTILFSHSF